MTNVKPTNISDYKVWLKSELKVTIDERLENHFDVVTKKIHDDFLKSTAWRSIVGQLNNLNAEYLIDTKYELFTTHTTNQPPDVKVKSFKSFLEKTFRTNILSNRKWPKPPEGGWILPENWFERTNDTVRTCFVVKYLDGVEFLLKKIISICEESGLTCENSYEARDEGYYAVHLYVYDDFNIPKLSWDTEPKHLSIELQITTQLQDVIGKLTHKYYEDRRVGMSKDKKKWQWQYESDEFISNYLGHILHYLEGMIMEVRERQSRGTDK